MKRDWMQNATMLLCLVLLAVTLVQKNELEREREELEHRLDRLEDQLVRRVDNAVEHFDAQLAEQTRTVKSYTLEPVGLDTQTRTLTANAVLSMKEWYTDTEATLLATVNGETSRVPMRAAAEDGTFSAPLQLPTGKDDQIAFSVHLSGGGASREETLTLNSELALLLPLQWGGAGGSGSNYYDGGLSGDIHILLAGRDEEACIVKKAVFRFCRNGEAVLTVDGVESASASWSGGVCLVPELEDGIWRVACESGDTVEIRFSCEDAYGLGYEYLLGSWTVNGAEVEGDINYEGSPTLYWPE